jgi:Rrf2 family transcriptional regulator, cysteine metabolism repressor
MKISTKGRYGLRALLDLATHSGDETTTLAAIAERQEISVGYLEQIFSALRKAGVVVGTKGPQGGYALGFPANKVSVRNVLDVLEGDLFTISDEKVEAQDASIMQAVLRKKVWERITGAALTALEGLTLENLAEAYEQAKMKDNYNFYI